LQKRADGILKSVLDEITEFQKLNNFIEVNHMLQNCLLERSITYDEGSERNFLFIILI